MWDSAVVSIIQSRKRLSYHPSDRNRWLTRFTFKSRDKMGTKAQKGRELFFLCRRQ